MVLPFYTLLTVATKAIQRVFRLVNQGTQREKGWVILSY